MNYRWSSDWVAVVIVSDVGVFIRANYLGSIVLVADLSLTTAGWRASIGDNEGGPEEVFASRDDAAAWIAPRALAALQDAPGLLKRRAREAAAAQDAEDVARLGAAFGAIAGLRARGGSVHR